MKHLIAFESFVELFEAKYIITFNEGQIKYWEQILASNPNKFKYAIKVLGTIKDQNRKATRRQKDILDRAARGDA